MTASTFEGATEGLSENQFKFIKEVLQKRGLANKKVILENVGSAGDNYMANVRRIIVQDLDGKPFKIIVKIASKNPMMRSMLSTHQAFYNEHVMYTEVLPKFKNIQKTAGVSKEDIFKFAECYGSYVEEPDELILLEDLKESNHIMLDRFQSLSNECMLSVLKNLAIFHSLSFVLKHNQPDMFHNFENKLFDIWSTFGRNEQTQNVLIQLEKFTLNLLSDSEERSKVVKGSITKIGSNFAKLRKNDAVSKHIVIKQGDAWTNNIMFRFDGEQLLDSIIIDYQMVKESKPVTDILFTIFNCADYQMRKLYFQDWIMYYHNELDRALSNYGLKASLMYSRDQLDADLKRYGKFMCTLCIFFANLLTMDSKEAAKVKESMGSKNGEIKFEDTQDNASAFKTRVEGLIDTCIEFGLV